MDAARNGGDDADCGRISTAVILHGIVHRSLRRTVESLRRDVIEPLARLGPVDLFFHSWDVAELRNPRGGEAEVALETSVVDRLLPEARGAFESQEEFDRTVDWERLFARNPMRNCCGSEEEARATLMNFRRALESQERAWRFFEQNRTRSYDIVVATRTDLRFLEELKVPEVIVAALCERRGVSGDPEGQFRRIDAHRATLQASHSLDGHRPPLQACLWLPRFHSWGGVNDRFAIGNEEGIRIWSNRVAFAEEWLGRANGESSEWLLMKWLEEKRVWVGFLDFTFQRVRANGEVAERDRELKAAGRSGEESSAQDARPTVRERFLILARENGEQAENLRKVLEPLGRVEVVVDRLSANEEIVAAVCDRRSDRFDGECEEGGSLASTLAERRYIQIRDEEVEGYGGLMGRTADFPAITAWSRAMVHLERTLEDDEAVWLVEDDVAADADTFARLVAGTAARNPDLAVPDLHTKQDDADWWAWGRADGFFKEPWRSFQPLCRLSARLLRAVLDFREEHGGFTFHEVLFASLARREGLRCLAWGRDAEFKYWMPVFRYRPAIDAVEQGICHPVKDVRIHGEICRAKPFEFPRRRHARCDGWSILPEDYEFLARYCRRYGIQRVVEFGPGDSTCAFLDAGCRVKSYEHDLGFLQRSLDRFEGERKVTLRHCPEGELPLDDDSFEPEMVFVDGPPYREGQAMSRLPVCEWALETCGHFMLHDSKRGGEQATLEEMARRGMHVLRIPTRKGLAIVTDPAKRPEMIPPMISGFLGKYVGNPGGRWHSEDLLAWSIFFGESRGPVKVLETGAGDGMSANLMLDELFLHAESEVHAVDLFDREAGEETRALFEANAASGGHAARIHLYEGTTHEVLAWMIAGDGFWESFDFIHLGGATDAADLLADACQAWSLLKPGGMLVMEADGATKTAVDSFRSAFGPRTRALLAGQRDVLVKRA